MRPSRSIPTAFAKRIRIPEAVLTRVKLEDFLEPDDLKQF